MLTNLSPLESLHEVIEYNDLKKRIIDYHQSGLYEQDIALILADSGASQKRHSTIIKCNVSTT